MTPSNKIKLLFIPIIFTVFCFAPDSASGQKNNKKVVQDTSKASKDSAIKSFDTFFKQKPISDTGLFITHNENGNYYFEIPDSLLQTDMLMVSRRVAMSSSEIDPMVAGDNAQSGGLMIQWDITPDGKSILLKKVTTKNRMRSSGVDSALQKAVALQTLNPILLSFPIKAKGKYGTNNIIDIKPLFLADIKELTPFAQNPFLKALGIAGKKYKLEPERSFIQSVKSFEQNLDVRSMLTYTHKDNIYSILVNRSMILLPRIPMRPRFADNRVGYFITSYSDYNENTPVREKAIIRRWRLEPAPEDMVKFEKGILVIPQKPIVFYIDEATPEKWVKYIKEGVRDWLPAFEAAGFKNAIVVKDYPVNDPDFNPEDLKYSVIRYAASDIANAKGPSVTDPRSGEILESDIIIYHNIFKLLRNWRFSQTAANDSRVRTINIPDSILGESLRYVAAHEVGHALGLRHNMGASFAFPVDSLRSATFTQKYGTTPSIMDYARNNYIAQPQDSGVKLTPPLLGIYDKYAISWGYKPIPEAVTPKDEIPVLHHWIEKHINDPRYRFGEGDVGNTDPSSLRESLGDNIVKASEYGVRNIKYILAHIQEWVGKDGASYDRIQELYQAALKQYQRYITQVATNIGGVYQHYPVQGQREKRAAYVSKEKQQQSVAFILKQYRELPKWINISKPGFDLLLVNKKDGVSKIEPFSSYIERFYRKSFQAALLNNGKLAYLIDNKLVNGNQAYSAKHLLTDLRNDVFKETMEGESVGFYRQMLQAIYVDRLINISKIGTSVSGGKKAAKMESYWHSLKKAYSQRCFIMNKSLKDDLYFQYMDFKSNDKLFKIESLVRGEMRSIKATIEKGIKLNKSGSAHYLFLLQRINLFLSEK